MEFYPPKDHPSIDDIRNTLTEEQKCFLDELWAYFRERQSWPTRWEYTNRFGSRKKLFQIATSLGGNLVFEKEGHEHNKIQLAFLGVLASSTGPEIEQSVLAFLTLLRKRLFEGSLEKVVDYSDICLKAGLSEDCANHIYYIHIAFRLIPSSSWSPLPDFSITVGEDIDGLSDFESPRDYLIAYTFDGYKENKPFSVDDRESAGLTTHYLTEKDIRELLDCCSLALGYKRRVKTASSVISIIIVSGLCAILAFCAASLFFSGAAELLPDTEWIRITARILGVLGMVFGITVWLIWKRMLSALHHGLQRIMNIGIQRLAQRARDNEVSEWIRERNIDV
jgi:hypothetical protein